MAMTRQVRLGKAKMPYSAHLPVPETAIPYNEFKKAGFEIDFITEKGNMPVCDAKMLTGMTQKLLVCYVIVDFIQDI